MVKISDVKIQAGMSMEMLPPSDDVFFGQCGLRILRAMRRIIRAVDLHSRELQGKFQITAPQMICLYSVAGQKGLTLSRLANEVSLGASTVTGIVDRLESKGWVRRLRDPHDRRKIELEITAAGQRIVDAAPPLLQDRFSQRLRELPELEQATIALSLERVVEMMEAENLDTSPNLIPSADVQAAQPGNQ
ncbi:MAG: MarR family transcriptional regulator [Lentisphaeria bacterium]|nr:MarR family transcriptional regulator [Lentisphaeria bacterium]